MFARMGWAGVAGATPRILLWGGAAFFAACLTFQFAFPAHAAEALALATRAAAATAASSAATAGEAAAATAAAAAMAASGPGGAVLQVRGGTCALGLPLWGRGGEPRTQSC